MREDILWHGGTGSGEKYDFGVILSMQEYLISHRQQWVLNQFKLNVSDLEAVLAGDMTAEQYAGAHPGVELPPLNDDLRKHIVWYKEAIEAWEKLQGE